MTDSQAAPRKRCSTASPRRGVAGTRQAILESARTLFSDRGYDGVGVREIGGLAGVNAALVNRYFGSKAELFQAAFASGPTLFDKAMADRSSFGAILAEQVLAGPSPERDALMAVLRSSWRPESTSAVGDMVQEAFVAPLAQWLGGPDGWNRAALVVAFVAALEMVVERRLAPADGADADLRLAGLFAQQLQALVPGPPATPRGRRSATASGGKITQQGAT